MKRCTTWKRPEGLETRESGSKSTRIRLGNDSGSLLPNARVHQPACQWRIESSSTAIRLCFISNRAYYLPDQVRKITSSILHFVHHQHRQAPLFIMMGTVVFLALNNLLWTIRSLQLLCATLVLAIFSYLLVALHEYGLQIDVDLRAVEGISGAAVLYTLINMLSQCCLASGLGCMSPLAVVFDVGFMAGFIFVAVVNKNGAEACRGNTDSPFGRGQGQLGDEASWPNMDGLNSHFRPHAACELQRASFFTSIIAM